MGKHTNDEKILIRIREGDQALLKEKHAEYWNGFFKFFYKNINYNKDLVLKDIYSESFLILYQMIKDRKTDVPLDASLLTILIGIGKNVLLRFFDKEKRNKEDLRAEFKIEEEKGFDPEIEAVFEDEANKKLVMELLEKVGKRCRQLIILRYIEEYEYDKIVKEMGFTTKNAARQKLHTCMKKLRDLLKNKITNR